MDRLTQGALDGISSKEGREGEKEEGMGRICIIG